MTDYKLVPVGTLKSIHRDLDACQNAIWRHGGFRPAYWRDAQARLKEIDELLAAPAVQGEPELCQECGGDGAGGEHEEDCAMAQPAPDAVEIDPNDLIVQRWSSKPLSQWDNSLERGIKITHVPTGISATCDTERSMHANKNKALCRLQSQLAVNPSPGVDGLEHEVRAMVGLLANGDWAGTHPRTDLGAALECQITKLVDRRDTPDVAGLVEALEAAQKEAVRGINHARNGVQAAAALGRVSAICGAALAAHRKQGDQP